MTEETMHPELGPRLAEFRDSLPAHEREAFTRQYAGADDNSNIFWGCTFESIHTGDAALK